VRTPQDVPSRAVKRTSRVRWWIVGGIAVLVVLLASLRSLAGVYTDNLWYSSVGLHRVWSTLLAVKIGLFASFGAAFFVLLWINLVLCDRLAAVPTGATGSAGASDDVVQRYQRSVRPYAGRVYAAIAFVAALVAAATTVGQWNNWLLFTHATSFQGTDPLFGLNVGFYVFRLPFLQFLLDWVLASLVVVLALTALFHYLNGGIRVKGAPHVRPIVKVHLSVLLALVALVKAVGYVLQRYSLVTSTNGYVEGAGYTDVHARMPALDILVFVSLFAAVVLLYNIRRQGWALPAIAVGLWAFVAVVIGAIYPAVLQALKVNPAQSKLETPYIRWNIDATRAAYGLDKVSVSQFPDSTTLPIKTVQGDITTLDNIRLWDPSGKVSLKDFQTKQDISNYYTFRTVQVERYTTGDTARPVVVGVREIDSTDLPSQSWVNAHLQYTHGEGVVVAEANKAASSGNPHFAVSDVPPKSTTKFPKIKQPAVYFGLGETGYVIADTSQPELNWQKPTGDNVEGHYGGSGGVRLTSVFTRAAFAIRMGDLNLLFSNLVTHQSRIMFVRNVATMAKKAAPFLSFDSQPYPAIVNGQIDWILNAYTTSADYPYSESASGQNIPPQDSLPGNYNYIRNSVIVVVNAYTGKMTFYAMDHDPILSAYEAAFPGMFTPQLAMPAALRKTLRYGTDMFAIQASLYGRYHITSPSQFYTAGDAWIVSPTTGVGSAEQTLQFNYVFNAGVYVSGTYKPMTPVYQVMALPGQSTQTLTVTDAYVPAGGGGNDSQLLRGLLTGTSGPEHFGRLHVYETPPGASKIGPIQAESEIEQTTAISERLTLLGQQGSRIRLGNILPIPVGKSVLYVRPLYVVSKTVPQPQLKYVIAVLGPQVRMDRTLSATLNSLLGTTLRSTSSGLTTTPNAPTTPPAKTSTKGVASELQQARELLTEAAKDYANAKADLRTGNLAGYTTEIAAAQKATAEAERLLGGNPASSTSAGSATAATPTGGSSSAGHAASGSGGSGSGSAGAASAASGNTTSRTNET
jgi:uncharacterized membrane protein (UPF0182 family)